MDVRHFVVASLACGAGLAALPIAWAQQRPTGTPAGWPCGARIDASYFSMAEATGGNMLLVPPGELAGSADLLGELDRHTQTLFRLGGVIAPGPHDFRIPIDPSVESLLVSISVQCLQTAHVIQPSGATASGAGVTDRANFTAIRMVTVERPEPGIWTVRAAGSGLAGVIVKARSTLQLASVEFAAPGGGGFGPTPRAGGENRIRISVTGSASHVEAALVNAGSKVIAALPLLPGDREGTYLAAFTPGAEGFRVMVTGQDAAGAPFQRVHAPLHMAK